MPRVVKRTPQKPDIVCLWEQSVKIVYKTMSPLFWVYLSVKSREFFLCLRVFVCVLYIVSGLFVVLLVLCFTSLVSLTGFYTEDEPLFCARIVITTISYCRNITYSKWMTLENYKDGRKHLRRKPKKPRPKKERSPNSPEC